MPFKLETITTNAFFDELEKISRIVSKQKSFSEGGPFVKHDLTGTKKIKKLVKKPKKSEWKKDVPWTAARAATGTGAALTYGYLLGNTLDKMKKSVKKVEAKYPKTKGFKPRLKRGARIFGAKSRHLLPYALLTGAGVSALKGYSESRIKRKLEKKYK